MLNPKIDKNQNNRYWFTAKKYGWGWTPATKEGWLIILIYISFVLIHATIYSLDPYSLLLRIAYFFDLIVSTVVLILICYKTGEKPRWRWGN